MFTLHPLTRENTPFPTSSNILAKYAHDGVSHADMVITRAPQGDDDERSFIFGMKKSYRISRAES